MIPTQQLFTPSAATLNKAVGKQSISQLAEFASSMVYLMWHGRKVSIKTSWGGNGPSLWQTTDKGACPTLAFKNFCNYVFTAAAIHESAVYLCLKYIAMLLQQNPTMEGSEGSEYRLFVVALMLACKFLDDNTFANTTWSEISGMKLRDLNLMEAEFMEALNYDLFVRSQEFNQWKALINVCRDRLSCYYVHTRPAEQEQLVINILYAIGLQPIPPPPPPAPPVVVQPVYHSNHLNYTNYYGNYSSREYTTYPSRDYAAEEAARIKQSQDSYNRCQHFMQSVFPSLPRVNTAPKPVSQPSYQPQQQGLPGPIQAPVGYPITNLSDSSWDPLAYTIHRSMYSNQTPISWSNF